MIKSKIISYIKKTIRVYPRINLRESASEVFIPENERFGHYSTNLALKLAKIKKQNPMAIAEDIKTKLLAFRSSLFTKIETAPPGFINFWLSEKTLKNELEKILKLKENYGASLIGKGKTIIIDYSAPNVAKPMTVGHLRSTIIGQALVNLFRFQGYKVIGDNHLGDWGTQFGALLVAYKKWGDKKTFLKNPIAHLVNLYICFHQELEKNKEFLSLAKKETQKLQKGDKENRQLWKLFVRESLKEFNKIYKRLDVKFDVVLGESFYQPMLKLIVEEAVKKGVAKISDGAIKIFYDNHLPALVIQKSDGAYLYSTTDLATVKYRVKRWQPMKILYVVANEQTLHFMQLFDAAKRLGYTKDDVLEHIKFGLVLNEKGKKMSTRRGEFIKLEKLLDKAVEGASKINKSVADTVGVGAIKYRALSYERKSDVVFDWKQMLDLKGNSGPYLQYTYARLKSVLRKAGKTSNKINPYLLRTDAEKLIIRQLIYFPDVLWRATARYETNYLTEYLSKLANLLNGFYEESPILKAEKSIRESRLGLIKAGSLIIKIGLNLLGIEVLEKI